MAVVFDVGNVLVHWDIRNLYARLIPDQALRDHFCTHIVTPDWHFQHDAGVPMAHSIPALVARHPEHRSLIEAYAPHWMETIGPMVDGMEEIICKLEAARVPMFAITNFSIELWPAFVAATPLVSRFRDVVVSGAHKIVKPDPAIYALALKRFKLQPNQAVFVDDRIENSDAAEANGFLGHHFQSAEKLSAHLIALGLLAG
jgi:2-haloacid dehalogenase